MKLTELLERVENADGPNLALEWEIHISLLGIEGAGIYGKHPNYTASVDAALALADRAAPDWTIHTIHRGATRWTAEMCRRHDWRQNAESSNSSLPLAICAALLKALIESPAGRRALEESR